MSVGEEDQNEVVRVSNKMTPGQKCARSNSKLFTSPLVRVENRLTQINLSKQQLKKVPSVLDSVQHLILDNNYLQSLPTELFLSNLKVLSAQNNKISELPSDLGTSLVKLYLQGN